MPPRSRCGSPAAAACASAACAGTACPSGGRRSALLRISIRDLRAGRVEWQGDTRAAGAPAGQPTSLELPVEVDIASLRVAEVRLGGADATPLLDLNASLHLGAELGSVHRVDKLAVTRDRIRISGSGQIATAAPLQLETHLEAVQAASAASAASAAAAAAPAAAALSSWTAVGSAVGPLAAPLVQATVRAAADGGRAAQSLDARATVRPFAAWPLGALELTAKGLDLSAFDAALPLTSLSGDARAQTQARDRPGTVVANLQNAAAGRWNENRLPVRSLHLEVRARPDDLDSLDVQALAAELGDRDAAAGHRGQRQWTGAQWAFDARLVDVRAPLLDARAPALTLGGTLALRATGPGAPVELQATVDGRLQGHGPARPVRLRLDGAASASGSRSAAPSSATAPRARRSKVSPPEPPPMRPGRSPAMRRWSASIRRRGFRTARMRRGAAAPIA